jgi:hypothetical protein
MCLPQRGKEAEDAKVPFVFISAASAPLPLCGQNECEKCERGVDHARRGRDALRRVREVVEVFVELVGERAVAACFGEAVPGWWIRGVEGVAACSS